MRVDVQCKLHGGMAGKVLHRLDGRTCEYQLRDICMPELVRRHMEVKRDIDLVVADLIAELQLGHDLFAIYGLLHRAAASDTDHIP